MSEQEQRYAELVLLSEGQIKSPHMLDEHRVVLRHPEIIIGRDPDADVVLAGLKQVSRYHCVIRYDVDQGEYAVKNSGSTFGTRLNNLPIEMGKYIPLGDGDEIELGTVLDGGALLRFYVDNPPDNLNDTHSDRTGRL